MLCSDCKREVGLVRCGDSITLGEGVPNFRERQGAMYIRSREIGTGVDLLEGVYDKGRPIERGRV